MLTFDCPSDATYRVPTPLFSEQRRVSDYDLSALWMGQWRTPIAMKLPGPGGVVAIATPDPWLHATLKRIAAHRNLSSGWDGGFAPVPPPGSLDTAEALAVGFLAKRQDRRPYFAVDSQGIPGFAANDGNFYLHLTVDAPGKLSWFAVLDGVEHFEDDVDFNGVKFPEKLAVLF
jgi:hypothetical protein